MQSDPEAGSLYLSGRSDARLGVPYAERVSMAIPVLNDLATLLVAQDRLVAR